MTAPSAPEPFWRREARYFFTALMYFSRLPCPAWTGYSAEQLALSRTYFPLIGLIIALISALVFALAQLVLPLSVAVLLSMCAGILATGAFHEDGFADVCDSFGGGYHPQQILTIMKDSRIGAYGAIGMVLILLLKFELLRLLAEQGVLFFTLCLCLAHSASRLAASMTAQIADYVQDIDQSKSKPIATQALSPARLGVGYLVVLAALLPFVLWLGLAALYLAALAAAGQYSLMRYFQRHIGGYTGDCLGATQQVCEILIYLGLSALFLSG